jgi:hypothetical protein
VLIASPNDNSKTSKHVIDVTGSVQDASASVVEIKVNGSPIQPVTMNAGSFSATADLKEGINTIDITTTESAGNITTAKRTVTSDTGTPSLSVNFPSQDITTLQKNILVNGVIADATSAPTVTLTVDGQSYTPLVTNGSFSQLISLGTEKTFSVMVDGVDEVGNHSATIQRNIIYRQPTLDDALRALKIAVGIVQKTSQDDILDVAPIVNNLSTPDRAIDIIDAVALLGKSVGVQNW